MKNKLTKIIIMVILVLTLTGCTTQLKNADKKIVKNSETGQSLTSNILCRPTDAKTIRLYEQNLKDLTKIPTCSAFAVTSGGYEGIWTTIFVKPLAWLIIKIGEITTSYGLSIILTTLFIRLLMVPLTKKSVMQADNLKNAKPELDKLEAKYKDKKDKDSMMQKSQEMMLIYKKFQISPASGCLYSFLQIPLFFAYYEAISRIPVIFSETFMGFQLGTNPTTGLTKGHYQYILFIILIVAATYYSFKLNGAAMSPDQEKQMKSMMNFMIVFIFIASLTLPTGIAVYWVTNNAFTIGQSLLSKRRKANDRSIKI